jgi:DNA-directed RNA polymerase specialized sigma24 family protein
MSANAGSVSTCLELLKQGNEAAAARLFDRLFRRLAGLARVKLLPLCRQAAADHEDVARSAFNDFWQAVRSDRYPDLHGSDDPWRVLATFVVHKAETLIDHEMAQKRGGGAVRGESVFEPTPGQSGERRGLDQLAARDDDPALLAEFEELLDRFKGRLDEQLREIAGLKLDGHSNEEIAQIVGISLAGVGRKLKVIRALLAETFGLDP